MRKSIYFLGFLFSCFFSYGQDFQKSVPANLNLIIGYETFNKFDDINSKLISNGFQKINFSPLVIGMEFSAGDKRNILVFQFYGTNLFKSKINEKTRLSSVNLSLVYGYGLLPNSKMISLFPLGGLRVHDLSIYSKNANNLIIDSHKPDIEALFGIGVKKYLRQDLTGVINNIGLNFTIGIPAIRSRWRKDGKDIISGSYIAKPTFCFTLTFGRAFLPANND